VNFGVNFKSAPERIAGERDDRLAMVKRKLDYHVAFLDDLLLGLLPHDLILLGAWTGVGKTACAAMIAQANAQVGRRVHFFALEAEPMEIERRIKFRMVSERLFHKHQMLFLRLRMRYAAWYHGQYYGEPAVLAAERDVEAEFTKQFSTLHTYYRGSKFAAEDIEKLFQAIQDQTDLIVLDHLHYVDNDDPNENRGYKDVVKRIRDIALRIGKPIVVIVHLRKRDRGTPCVVPTLDDVHGSSDIVKIATRVIMLAPMSSEDFQESYPSASKQKHCAPTYIFVAKDRISGLSQYCAVANYDLRLSGYENSYRLGTVVGRGERFVPLAEDELPDWAKREERRTAIRTVREPGWDDDA
jgi:hypothetical protein